MQAMLVQTAVETQEAANILARKALEAKLAACVQGLPARSHYFWQNEYHCESEIILNFKTLADKRQDLCELLKAEHPYEVPEIVCIAISEVDQDYMTWMQAFTAGMPDDEVYP